MITRQRDAGVPTPAAIVVDVGGEMPKRLIEPAWRGMKSPVTLKSILFFLAVVFIAYTTVRDYQQRQASMERFQVLAKYTEETRIALEQAKVQNAAFAQSIKNTEESLKFMAELRTSMADVAEILRLNRVANATEHQSLYDVKPQNRVNPRSPVRRSRTRKQKRISPCYEMRPIEKKYGDSSVVVNTLIETPCP